MGGNEEEVNLLYLGLGPLLEEPLYGLVVEAPAREGPSGVHDRGNEADEGALLNKGPLSEPGLGTDDGALVSVEDAAEVGHKVEEDVEGDEPSQPLVVGRTDGEEAHVGAEVPVGGNEEEVNLLDLGLGPLLEEGVVNDLGVGVAQPNEPRNEQDVKGEHGHCLLLEGVPKPRELGGLPVLGGREVGVGVPSLVDEHNVELDEVGVVPSNHIVADHEADKLVDVEVLVSEEGGVGLVGATKEAPEDVSRDGNGYVAQVVGAEGNPQEDDDVVDEEGVGPSKPPVEVALKVVLDVDLLEDVEVREDEDGVNTDDVHLVHVVVPPYLVHVLLAEGDDERGVGHVVEAEEDPAQHLGYHVN